ncbi:O-antigen ligase family protein [Peribacillus simplex]|uniref:O-antigen ligase family protein n=1 Tax=Peribacillus simplex TaxID=1478 RepID=UPI003CE8E085
MEKLLFSLVIFFSYFFIISYKHENIVVYGSTLSCVIFCFYHLLIILKTREITIKITKEDRNLIISFLLYAVYTFLIGIIFGIENMSFFKVLSNNLFILTFILMLINFENYKESFRKISILISYGFITVGIFSIILYLNKIYGVIFNFKFPFVSIYNEEDMLSYYREIRFQSMFSHKAKFAFYCIIGIFLLSINKKISTKVKYFGLIILFINVILTNSITSMLASGLLLWTTLDFKKINRYLRFGFYLISLLILIPYVLKVFNYMSTVRELDTLGSRGVIWGYAIEFYKSHLFGVIDNWYFYTLGNMFKGAHNVFLNEILDYGIIGGILFFVVFINYFYSLYRLNKRNISLLFPTIILFMVDNILYGDIVPVFLFAFILIKIISSANNNHS